MQVFILWVADQAARLIDGVSINRTHLTEEGLIKRRLCGRSVLIAAGNVFLSLSQSRIQMFIRSVAWQLYEIESYRRLYGGGCERFGKAALRITPFHATSLKTHLERGSLSTAMLVEAAREIRRMHNLTWSHGDLHLANVLVSDRRAWIIDFETYHLRSMTFDEKAADDLLVLLLDLIGRDSSDQWLLRALVILDTYSSPVIFKLLLQRLKVPSGWELILWKTRTNFLPMKELRQRLSALCSAVYSRISSPA